MICMLIISKQLNINCSKVCSILIQMEYYFFWELIFTTHLHN